MAGPVTAYNWVQVTTAAIVGPTRSRLRQVVIYAAAAGALTVSLSTVKICVELCVPCS